MDTIGVLVICLFFTTFSAAKPQEGRGGGFSVRKASGGDDDDYGEVLGDIFGDNSTVTEVFGEIFGDNSSETDEEDFEKSTTKVVDDDLGDDVTTEIDNMEAFDKNAAKVVVNSIKKFRKTLFDEVKNVNENQIMSSYSLVSALGMLLNGASGETANQVLSSFGLEEEKDFIQNYKLVANQLKSNENFKLNSANRLVHILYIYI